MAMRTMNPRNDRYGDSSLNDAISPNVSLFLNLFGYFHVGFALGVEFFGVVSGLIFHSMHDFDVNVYNFHSSVQHVENSKYNATKHPRVYLLLWIPSLEPLSASPTTMLKMDTRCCDCAPT